LAGQGLLLPVVAGGFGFSRVGGFAGARLNLLAVGTAAFLEGGAISTAIVRVGQVVFFGVLKSGIVP